MIAHAASEGNSVKNLIEYLYSGREEGHKGEDKQADLVTIHDTLIAPINFQDRAMIDRLKVDFQRRQEQYSRAKNEPAKERMGHHIISFSESDMSKMTAKKVKQITEEYIKLAGLDETQHIALSHKDTDSFHVHIAFSRVLENGKLYKSWQEKNKTIERGIALNLKHGLQLEGDQHKVSQTRQVVELRSSMDDMDAKKKVIPELDKARNLQHLKKLCEQSKREFRESDNTVQIGNREYAKANILAACKRNNDQFKEKQRLTKFKATVPELTTVRSLKELEAHCKKTGQAFEEKDKKVLIGSTEYSKTDVYAAFEQNTEQFEERTTKREKGLEGKILDGIKSLERGFSGSDEGDGPTSGKHNAMPTNRSVKEDYQQRLRRKRKGHSHKLKGNKSTAKAKSKEQSL